MTNLLETAIQQAAKLPPQQQDILAQRILAEDEYDRILKNLKPLTPTCAVGFAKATTRKKRAP